MADRISRERRSANMAAIRGCDTSPEIAVRRALRAARLGYRLQVARLPGRPDIVLLGRRKVIFVNGCFWHRHEGCRFAYTPRSNVAFWEQKFAATVERDRRNTARLLDGGWDVITVWECETRDAKILLERIIQLVGVKEKR